MIAYISLIIINISFSMWVTFALLMWFEGDITNLFSRTKWLKKFFLREEYENYMATEDLMATYPEFLHAKYNMFITKLISCVLCLSAWLTLFTSVIGCITLNIAFIWILLFLPINYIVTLITYLLIRKLL